VRLEQVLDWLTITGTDVLALQETKLTDERFPLHVFQEAGFHVCFSGQKTYNGVAIISRQPLIDVTYGIPSFDDDQRRVIAATVGDIRIVNVYVPNGAAVGTEKYDYKLVWLDALTLYLEKALRDYPKLVILGDFNIAPADEDVHDPELWRGSVLVSEPERGALQKLLDLGLVDTFRMLYPEAVQYTWWDYRQARFRRNHGLRIDLILLSRLLYEACKNCHVDVSPRKHERPSDHTPVIVELDALS
jgi:exodeoxyribonuclease III